MIAIAVEINDSSVDDYQQLYILGIHSVGIMLRVWFISQVVLRFG